MSKFWTAIVRAVISDPWQSPEYKARMERAHQQDAELNKYLRLIVSEGKRIEAELARKAPPDGP